MVLDLFAGTGAMGLEALSRGARAAVFVERNQGAFELIQRNIALCGFSDKSSLVKKDLTKGLFFLNRIAPPAGFDLVFLDPPYGRELAGKILHELAEGQLLSPRAAIVAEQRATVELPQRIGALQMIDRRQYGEAGFWLYRQCQAEENPKE